MGWRLLKADGSQYGPISLALLRRWAMEGRVAPEDQVAEEGGEWRPAPSVEELEMTWLLLREAKPPFGPLNLFAFADLVQQGTLAGTEQVAPVSGGDPVPLAIALARALLQAVEPFQKRLIDMEGLLTDVQQALEAQRRESERLRLREKELVQDLESTKRALEKAMAEHDALRADLERVRADEQQARADLQILQNQLDAYRHEQRKTVSFIQRIAPASNEGSVVADQPTDGLSIARLESEYQDASRRCERLWDRIREEESKRRELIDALDAQKREAAAEQKKLESRLSELNAELEKMRSKYDEKERSFQILVQEFRELNDRYIRLKNDYDRLRGGGDRPKVRLA